MTTPTDPFRAAFKGLAITLAALNTDTPEPVREAKLYGGQAVIEGVLMKSAGSAVVSVRESAPYVKNEKGKWVESEKDLSDAEKAEREAARPIVSKLLWQAGEKRAPGWKQKPFIRGIFVLIESLSLGMKALEYSSEVAMQSVEGQEEQSTLSKVFGYILAFGLAIGLFVALPTWGAEKVGALLPVSEAQASLAKNALEGLFRIVVFIGYISVIKLLSPDIMRVFKYHGAEHKTVNAYEAMVPLTVGSVQQMPTFHRRCGTSFIFLVAIVHIIIAAFTGWPETLLERIVRGVLLFAPVASVSYEILRITAAHPDAWWSKMASAPGIMFQRLTALQPSDSMAAVAITAFNQVMDGTEGPVELQPA